MDLDTNSTWRTIDDALGAAVTHTIGAVISLPGSAILIGAAALYGDSKWDVLSTLVYGIGLVSLYVASSLYHAFAVIRLNVDTLQDVADRQLGLYTMPIKVALSYRVERWLRVFDHTAILLLFGATYTPLTLVTRPDNWSWVMLPPVWIAVLGASLLHILLFGRSRLVAATLYTVVAAIVSYGALPILVGMPLGAQRLMELSVVCLCVGLIFFFRDGRPFAHTIWHLCVLLATACHFLVVLRYVVLA